VHAGGQNDGEPVAGVPESADLWCKSVSWRGPKQAAFPLQAAQVTDGHSDAISK
jgi:hypothetical protein